jgi:hypothetical protein
VVALAKPHTAPVSRREKGPTMLSAAFGMLAMLPLVVSPGIDGVLDDRNLASLGHRISK